MSFINTLFFLGMICLIVGLLYLGGYIAPRPDPDTRDNAIQGLIAHKNPYQGCHWY